MNWFGAIPAFVVAALILVLPGMTVALLLRQRGMRLFGVAPAISVSLIAVSALAAPIFGLRWTPFPLAVLLVVAAVAAAMWSRYMSSGARTPRTRTAPIDWSLVIALAVPALVIGFVLLKSFGDPEFISQRYDNFFHLNGVQYVLDTGNASPLWLGSMTSQEGVPFYPSAWHALVALVVQVSGVSIASAVNATIVVVAAVVWPLAAVMLARTLLGRGRVVTVAAGCLSASFPAFPYLPLHYGVLYPLFLGLAIAPVAIALVWSLLRPTGAPRRVDTGLLLVLVIPGLAVSHPGALMALVALTLPFVLGALAHRLHHSEGVRGRIVVALATGGYLGAGLILLTVVRPPASQIYWPVIETVPHAIGEVVTSAVYQYPASYALGVALVAGAYSVVKRGGYTRWGILGMAVVGSVLYVVVASSPYEILRFWLTAPWYNNAPRLASIWVIAVLPLGALGVSTITSWLLRRPLLAAVRRGAERAPAVVALLLAVVLVLLTQTSAMRQAAADIEFTYKLRSDGPILSVDERELIDDLPDLVPEGAVIAGDPWTGASFAYGLSGREVLMPHLLMDLTDDAELINTRLATDADSPAVCRALEETRVRYVLDFSADGDFQENPDDYSGLEDLDDSPYVKLVESRGEAKLFEITSCRGAE
ncbi:DUF6541 family protein [Microbacterium sp.]|uniref:DUF6541 family protein n=1 Tax=Microbacterium sp. TaxID=51671 RepID=UPI0028115AC9|nr:DUF6541 family protein [Microbacterium sp.]